jgi:poly-beta-1,6-N-acetyl-D-glucosamine synthase
MSVLVYILFSFLVFYALILAWTAIGFAFTPYFKAKDKNLQVPLSIIICARNEEKNISICLNSLLKQNYVLHKVQLILMNDASRDNTVQRAEAILSRSGINYQIISNAQQKGKKQSISYAMQFVKNKLILLRDADTFTLSPSYLQSISDFYQKTNSDLIIAPIAIANSTGLLWALQSIENNILALVTGGSAFYKKAFLCNGANLIFTKEIFEKVGGYSSHMDVASGDDIYFLEDVKKVQGSKVNYLKSTEALVYTYPTFSFSALLNQKIRWASKFKRNKNKLNFSLALISFMVNLLWVLSLLLLNFHVLRQQALLFISLKLIIDILLLFLASAFIKNKQLLWYSLPVACIYPVYAVIVGISSLFVKTKWK